MNVTRCKVYSSNVSDNPDVLAEATVTLDDSLLIHGIKVIRGKKGLFIAFPNRGVADDSGNKKRYLDVVHPCSESLRKRITEEVLKEYNTKF